ncbi:hypothetical protein F5B22DRAFT_592554 [Xylaria bambusicola]|uniref:uncharacterized protein n=1 Tax=Xylaria bambusicola TaxID=326684 RepID=UPI0020088662|nr:uncharacterized protein F5B22DRAFT_592554 [Xylaria bambusicola]KAI0523938.1 hypothetical protein F5B22DRAFT_592554 [Xylaria bambusicola]
MGSYRPVYYGSECEYPRFPNRRWGSCIWVFVVVFFAAAFLVSLGGIAANIFLIIKFIATDTTNFSSQAPEFPLYKNSRFEECSSLVPDAANCTAIMDIISHTSYPLDQDYLRRGYIPISTAWRGVNGTYFDWCTAASCFNGYTVIPSTARPGVIGLTTFGIWTNVNILTLKYLFAFLKRNWALYRSDDRGCKGGIREIGLIDWVLLLSTAGGEIIWWWVDYIEFVQNPIPNTTLSIYAWAATWLLASIIHYHPYSCVLDRSPVLKRVLSWVLALLTVAQWAATIHVLAVGRRYTLETLGIYQGYDCVESMVTGTAQCSAQRLCSDAPLLGNMPFYWDFLEHMISQGSVALFVILSLVAIQPFVLATWRYYIGGAYSWSELFKRVDIGPIAGPATASIFGAFFTGIAASVGVYLLTHTDREAPIVASPYCNAVHVGLSTWRYYLDLDPNSRALRIVKAFFNA